MKYFIMLLVATGSMQAAQHTPYEPSPQDIQNIKLITCACQTVSISQTQRAQQIYTLLQEESPQVNTIFECVDHNLQQSQNKQLAGFVREILKRSSVTEGEYALTGNQQSFLKILLLHTLSRHVERLIPSQYCVFRQEPTRIILRYTHPKTKMNGVLGGPSTLPKHTPGVGEHHLPCEYFHLNIKKESSVLKALTTSKPQGDDQPLLGTFLLCTHMDGQHAVAFSSVNQTSRQKAQKGVDYPQACQSLERHTLKTIIDLKGLTINQLTAQLVTALLQNLQ